VVVTERRGSQEGQERCSHVVIEFNGRQRVPLRDGGRLNGAVPGGASRRRRVVVDGAGTKQLRDPYVTRP
jgi:hypothetical protein